MANWSAYTGSIFVDCGLDMPAGEVAAIAAGKRSGSEAADGNALPVAVINIAGRRASRLDSASGSPSGRFHAAFGMPSPAHAAEVVERQSTMARIRNVSTQIDDRFTVLPCYSGSVSAQIRASPLEQSMR